MNCENCGAPAAVNVQKAWICWEYDSETEEYSKNHKLLLDTEGPTGNENLHLCRKCFENWRNESTIL